MALEQIQQWCMEAKFLMTPIFFFFFLVCFWPSAGSRSIMSEPVSSSAVLAAHFLLHQFRESEEWFAFAQQHCRCLSLRKSPTGVGVLERKIPSDFTRLGLWWLLTMRSFFSFFFFFSSACLMLHLGFCI